MLKEQEEQKLETKEEGEKAEENAVLEGSTAEKRVAHTMCMDW